MADLNSLIAQGVQFRAPPDPFAQYAQMQQLQQGEQANQMNQMLMQEKQRGFQEQNQLRGVVSRPGFDPMNPTHAAEAYAVAPTLAPKYLEQVLTTRESRGKITAADIKAKSDREGMLAQAGRDMAQRPDNENIISHNRDVQGSNLFTQDEKARVQARTDMLLGLPMDQRAAAIGNPGASAADLKPQVVGAGASLVRPGADKPYFTAPAAPTDLAKLQTEMSGLPAGDPRIPQYVDAIRKATQFAPQAVTTIKLPPQQGAEQAKRGEMLVSEYSDISKVAKLAAKTIPSIDANLNILNKGFETGFGTETKAAGAKVLGALGVQNAENFATDAQAFQAKATEMVLQKQLEQKGPQTESDAQRIDQVGAQLGKTTAGNKFVLTTAKEQYKRDMEQRNFYANWYKNNKTYDGAEDAWYAGEGGKSLFDRPALKQYAGGADAAARIPGQGAAANIPGQAKPPRTVTRTGTSGGKKVIEYSDGSVEYAPG
jgi:hypothetical protein